MESSEDKNWATAYLLDPLTAPDPAAETGPGAHFRPMPSNGTPPTPTSPTTSNKLTKNPYRRSSASSKRLSVPASEVRRSQSTRERRFFPSPPISPSQAGKPEAADSSHRREALGEQNRRRGSSLGSRYPGDLSHQPLTQLRAEQRAAHRAPHLRKRHQISPDTIDTLDTSTGGVYHHGGPYDATLFEPNNSYKHSPLQALEASNAEALKATPREKVLDSLWGHRPLDGVAMYAPGERDMNGQVYDYEQGDNMMIEGDPEGGPYKRWPGVEYHPDDVKGKGEPSYTIEKALKDHSRRERKGQASQDIEAESHSRNASPGSCCRLVTGNLMWGDEEQSRLVRSASGKEKRLSGGGLKKRFNSLKKHVKDAQFLP